MTTTPKCNEWQCPDWRSRLAGTVIAGFAMVILFRDLLAGCFDRWMTEPQYAHGLLVPVAALVLGWSRRGNFLHGTARSSPFGLGLILVGIVGHFVAAHLFVEPMDAASFMLTLTGVTLLIWGRRACAGLWPVILFLGFMLPLPTELERVFAVPLQNLGANEATWYIQTLGIPAIPQGNSILVGDTRMDVAEACSGLRMMLMFLAISTAGVIISKRTKWEKLLMLLSAPAIAIVCNVAKITGTAVAHQTYQVAADSPTFNALSGWLMMPCGVLLLYLELRLLDYLFVPAGDTRPGMTYHVATQPVSIRT